MKDVHELTIKPFGSGNQCFVAFYYQIIGVNTYLAMHL